MGDLLTDAQLRAELTGLPAHLTGSSLLYGSASCFGQNKLHSKMLVSGTLAEALTAKVIAQSLGCNEVSVLAKLGAARLVDAVGPSRGAGTVSDVGAARLDGSAPTDQAGRQQPCQAQHWCCRLRH